MGWICYTRAVYGAASDFGQCFMPKGHYIDVLFSPWAGGCKRWLTAMSADTFGFPPSSSRNSVPARSAGARCGIRAGSMGGRGRRGEEEARSANVKVIGWSFQSTVDCLKLAIAVNLAHGNMYKFAIAFEHGHLVVGAPIEETTSLRFVNPPHCLKKKGIPWRRHCLRMETTHLRSIGRAPIPLSPPTITHLMPSKFIVPKSSRSGSTERNRRAAGEERK